MNNVLNKNFRDEVRKLKSRYKKCIELMGEYTKDLIII